MRLDYTGSVGANDALLDVDIRDMTVMSTANGTYLFTATGVNGGLCAYRITSGGAVQLIDRLYFTGQAGQSAEGHISQVSMGGHSYLAIGSANSATGASLVAFRVWEGGTLGQATQIGNLAQNARVTDVETLPDQNRMITSDATTGTLVSSAGERVLGQVALNGAAELSVLTLADQDYVIAAVEGTNSIVSVRVDSSSGALETVSEIGAASGLGIAAPTAVTTFQAYGKSWVVVAGAESSSLSVLRIDPAGNLTATGHVIDGLTTRFGDVQALGSAHINGRTFLVAGGGDDGLSLFTLLPDGQLLHLHTLAHETGLGLENVTALELVTNGNRLDVLVSSQGAAGLAHFTIDLGDLTAPVLIAADTGQRVSGTAGDDLIVGLGGGRDTIYGGAGDDILVAGSDGAEIFGGAGADTFVITAGNHITQIRDFTLGVDTLDLSRFEMLRSLSQLDIRVSNTVTTIRYDETEIRLFATGNAPATGFDIFGPAFDWADNILVLTEPEGVNVTGGRSSEFIRGTERADTIDGGGGSDAIWSQDGNDILIGNWGNDALGGQGGNDTLFGNQGNDMLAGGDGDDRLDGADGLDALWGGHGNDVMLGGEGDDTLGGSFGNDRLDGGTGDDDHWGGPGNDTVYAGDGDDMIGGHLGDDLLFGGAGNDEIWGAWQNDEAHGGTGNDRIGAGPGDDTVFGNEGNDVIYGGLDNDRCRGGADDDELFGASGNDRLWGDEGQDTIWGGPGNDFLYGGSGADLFHFAPNQGNDRMFDFEPGIDTIRLWGAGDSFGSLSFQQDGDNVELSLGSGRITFFGLDVSALSAGDFDFG